MVSQLSTKQLEALEAGLQAGARQATGALLTWLGVESLVEVDSVKQSPIQEASAVLSQGEGVVCVTSMGIAGDWSGQLILGFDDTSGMSLCDLILDRPVGTAKKWSELEKSAALETMNIVGSSYLNQLAKYFSQSDKALELIPAPPLFHRDFAEPLVEAAIMDQAMSSDLIFVAKTRFSLRGESLKWTLLFVPDGPSMLRIAEWSHG